MEQDVFSDILWISVFFRTRAQILSNVFSNFTS